jgi:predicted nucleotidyltransferase
MEFTPEQLARIRALCEEYGVRELALFGSRARGDNRQDSDYDFLVDFREDMRVTLFTLAGLRLSLLDLLGREVDLVPRDAMKPRVAPSVLRDSAVLYAT